jgi:hypothetical protein
MQISLKYHQLCNLTTVDRAKMLRKCIANTEGPERNRETKSTSRRMKSKLLIVSI